MTAEDDTTLVGVAARTTDAHGRYMRAVTIGSKDDADAALDDFITATDEYLALLRSEGFIP